MSARQNKTQKQKAKRATRRREKQRTALRLEKGLRTNAHPLHACVINREWSEDGMASILVARRVGVGRVTMSAFLVDIWAMGLKDAWGRTNIPTTEFNECVADLDAQLETCPLNLGIARHLVYGGVDLSRELGFRLPRRYERWTAILGPLPEGELPDKSLFLDEGTIRLTCSREDLEARLIGCTPQQFLRRSDVDAHILDHDFTLFDPEVEEAADALDEMQDLMFDRAKQWCFANGQQPHTLLRDLIGAMIEASAQSPAMVPETAEPWDDLTDEQRELAADQADEFLSATFHADSAGLDEAKAQLAAFTASLGSVDAMIESIGQKR